jgi:hypothetical protein
MLNGSEILHETAPKRGKCPRYFIRDYHDIAGWFFYSIQKGLNLRGSRVGEIFERATEKSFGGKERTG